VKLGEFLLKEKIITEEQLKKALEYQEQHPGTMLGQAILALGFATDEEISDAVLKTQWESI
jgi:hypothetical protein